MTRQHTTSKNERQRPSRRTRRTETTPLDQQAGYIRKQYNCRFGPVLKIHQNCGCGYPINRADLSNARQAHVAGSGSLTTVTAQRATLPFVLQDCPFVVVGFRPPCLQKRYSSTIIVQAQLRKDLLKTSVVCNPPEIVMIKKGKKMKRRRGTTRSGSIYSTLSQPASKELTILLRYFNALPGGKRQGCIDQRCHGAEG